MKAISLYKLLKLLNIPISYRTFKKPPQKPYIIYYAETERGSGSDFKNGIIETDYVLELYSDKKESELENRIKKLLSENGIDFFSFEEYLAEEKMLMKSYEFNCYEKMED